MIGGIRPSLENKRSDSSIGQFHGRGEPRGPSSDDQHIRPFEVVVHVA
jgi:hypothetical protein